MAKLPLPISLPLLNSPITSSGSISGAGGGGRLEDGGRRLGCAMAAVFLFAVAQSISDLLFFFNP